MTTTEFSYNLAGSVRHQGLPVAGVSIFAYEQLKHDQNPDQQDRLVAWQKTGTKGDFSFAVKPGIYRLEARSFGNRFLNESLTDLVVMANTICSISLSTGYIVNGQVFTKNGTKVAQGSVVAQEIGSSLYFTIGAVDNGNFNLVVPRGEYRLAYRPLALENLVETQNGKNNSLENENIIVPTYLPTDFILLPVWQDSDVEIILPQLVSLKGTLVDHTNSIVSGATVIVAPSKLLGSTVFSELGLAAKCTSDAHGCFQIFLQPGTYDFTLAPTESSALFTLTEERISIYENCIRKYHLKEGCRLEGKILHHGEIIPNCSITIFDSEDQLTFHLKTNGQGQFQTKLPKGRYKILASISEPANSIDEVNNSPVLAPAISDIVISGKTSVTIELQQGTIVFGKVTDESKRARMGVSVSAFLNTAQTKGNAGSARKPMHVLNSGITDGEGNYHLHLAPGSYSLVVNNDFVNAKFVELSLSPLELDFILPGWRQLSIEIVGEDGLRISNCRLGYAPYAVNNGFPEMHKYENVFDSQLARGTLFSGSSGLFKIVLPSGVYTLEISPPKNSSYEGKLIRQLSLSMDSNKKVVLPLKTHLAGSTEEFRLI